MGLTKESTPRNNPTPAFKNVLCYYMRVVIMGGVVMSGEVFLLMVDKLPCGRRMDLRYISKKILGPSEAST